MHRELVGRDMSPFSENHQQRKLKHWQTSNSKKLLNKQLSKNTTITAELKRKKNMCQPILVKDESSASKGFRSLCEFQEIMLKEKHITSLREHGLTEEEIKIKLNSEKNKETSSHVFEQLKVIDGKINEHKEFLLQPSQFTESVDVSRREFETDNALNLPHGSSSTQTFSPLVNLKEKEYSSKDPVWATLKEYEESKRKESIDVEESESESDSEWEIHWATTVFCKQKSRNNP